MFTGIIEELGEFRGREGDNQGIRLLIAARRVIDDLLPGQSIAVNGVCLTATRVHRDSFEAQVMPETLRKTNLNSLKRRQPVNLERALALGDRLGGHLVSGHVDGMGRLSWARQEGQAILFYIETPFRLLRYIINKGSIAVDGISLTVADLDERGFTVSVIPHTAKNTTLSWITPGVLVNLEVDVIGKYVEKLLSSAAGKEQDKSKITVSFLQETGFI
ncbi:MAG TPA: riboflavin synthase [Firmicutes bacterium]|nr:riboflavin synthase [Bacillota bacterium]